MLTGFIGRKLANVHHRQRAPFGLVLRRDPLHPPVRLPRQGDPQPGDGERELRGRLADAAAGEQHAEEAAGGA